MRLLIAGGGTGGHLFPGLAVAERWRESGRGEVAFVGSRFGLENRVVPAHHYAFFALPIRAARGRGIRGWVQFCVPLPVALWKALRAQRAFAPDVVVGLGGYSSVPSVLVAWLSRIPVVLLEQNAHPGMANRLLGRVATRVCTGFPVAAGEFPPGKAVYTGNPVRALPVGTPKESTDSFTLLVLGGSQGARSLNRTVVRAAPSWMREISGFRLVHQTGSLDETWVRHEYEQTRTPAQVYAFIDDMGAAYTAADLVLCRAGASTLAELALMGKPAILVPYPYAADDHQRKNAEAWQRAGAAEVLLDRELSPSRLEELVVRLARDARLRQKMADNARSLARPQAAEEVARVCEEVGRKA